jgi:6-phosphogluconolactonase
MAEFSTEKRVVISPDADTLASDVAARLLDRLVRRSAAGKTSHVALTGGVIGTDVLRAAGRDPRRGEVDWSTVHFWWGDDSFIDRESAERNETAARRALIDHIEVPAGNVHPMPAAGDADDLEAAAAAYAEELSRHALDGQDWPRFYVCFLGVGADGHIASLFPDRGEIQVTDQAVVPVREAPKPPADRLSLTRPVINSARSVWMVLSGSDKAAALGLALAGASYESVPAAGAKGVKRTVLFVDEAAALQVPPDLIDPEF